MLKIGLPATPRSNLTKVMQKNLKDYEAEIQKQVSEGKISLGEVVVVELDRAFGKKYSASYQVDISPCLKTGLKYLFLISTHDLEKPVEQRDFFRWMMPFERPALQGCTPWISRHFRTADLIHACGNAYPIPLIGACALPVLELMEKWSGFKNWPPKKVLKTGVQVPEIREEFIRRLQRKAQQPEQKAKAKGKNAKEKKPKKERVTKRPATKQNGSVKKKPAVNKRPSTKRASMDPVLSHGVLLARPKSKSLAGPIASTDEEF